MENTRLHAVVEGRVQGVSFRYFVLETTQRLNVTGWVRNRWGGSVEVLAEGQRQELDRLLAALHRGPRAANVTAVDHQWENATGDFTNFRIRMTR